MDVLEGLVDPALGRPLPLLVVGTTRPEVLELRLHWANDTSHRTTVTLDPLAAVDTGRLLEALLALHEVAVTVPVQVPPGAPPFRVMR